MRKYVLVTLIVILFVILSVSQIQSQIKAEENEKIIKNKQKVIDIEQTQPVNPDILKVQYITNWDLEIAEYFVNEANSRGVKIFEECLPIIAIETGHTYRFDLIHYNKNRTTDQGLFQINDILYSTLVKSLKAEGREFDSWNRLNPEFNISAGMYWLGYLKSNHQLEGHRLFSSYNRGISGAKYYASRHGSYETEYSRKVYVVRSSYRM